MLGLGNRLNKSRVYKTFVGENITYDYIANGQIGQGGYIIDHSLNEGENTITYTEVLTDHLLVFGNSSPKTTASIWGPYIYNAFSEVSDLDGDGTTTEYSDWRMLTPSEFTSWKNNVYVNHPNDYYAATDDGYINCSLVFWNTWSGNGFELSLTSNDATDFTIGYTDSLDLVNPSGDSLLSGSFYCLAAREFTVPITGGETSLPTSSLAPLEPLPADFQQRSSGNLTSEILSGEDTSVVNLSLNSEYLEGSDVPMYISRPTGVTGSDENGERFKLQVNLEFPVDASNNPYTLPSPWNIEDLSQKKARLEVVILGWEDAPYVSLQDGPTEGLTWSQLGSLISKTELINIDLNKVANSDLTSPSFALNNGLYAGSGGALKFGYTGYADLSALSMGMVSSDPVFNDKTIAEACFQPAGGTALIANLPPGKNFFMVRVSSITYYTDASTDSELVVMPQNLKYVMMPLLTDVQTSVFYNALGQGADLDEFINATWTSAGSNLPPEIEGQNEDYYN